MYAFRVRGSTHMKTTEPVDQDNSIVVLLQNQRAGVCMDELSRQLAELTKTVRNSGRKGKLVLELTVNPLQKGGGRAVTVTDKITLKLPTEEPEVSVFFVGDEGELTRNDPRQRELNLREIEGGKTREERSQSAAV